MQDELANLPGDPKACNVIRVVQVMDDSAAHKAGLQMGDLIAGLENEFWRDGPAAIPFGDRIRAKKPNTRIALQVIREGKLVDVEVVLGRRPMMLNQLFLNQTNFDPDAAETAAREAYFRRWLSQRKVPD
jgi:predicted metalloprotease with PDZ domain